MKVRTVARRSFFAILLASLVFSSCLNDSTEPTIDLDATSISGTAIALPSPTETANPEPTVSSAPWLPALLDPGPPGLISPVVFFLNGPDVWLIDSDLEVQQVTEQRRVRHVATLPGSATAAIVLIGSQGGRETEEIRIVDANGNESEPIYGPEIVADPGGNARITMLAWSPDGQQLAIVRDDGSIWIGGSEQFAEPISTNAPTDDVEQVGWSATGDALILLVKPPGEPGIIRLVPLESEGYFDIAPLQSFSNACWPPGQAHLIVTEARLDGRNPNAGSLFTIRPDGTDRQLLASAGEFGPAVSIGQFISSPDGTHLAFTVEVPNSSGEFQFQSLYLLEIGSGVRRELSVAPGQLVNDLWWFEGGLAWRATSVESGQVYDGVEPFQVEMADLESGTTQLIYTSNEE